jgi:hypothetical protein
MVGCYRGIVYQTLKNQPIGNVKIRCRLEKIDKTGKPQQADDINPVTTDLLKTISMGSVAGGLIFKGLICPFRLVMQDILP